MKFGTPARKGTLRPRKIMTRILAAAILSALTLGVLGCASHVVSAEQSQRFSSDPYNYELSKNL
jgi:hypothetical protein